jgi:cellobiose phosphorylase
VVAADVYAVAPHTGRGGWSWYTGSAGWMYRLIVESLLGVTIDDGRLRFAPCLPADWTAFAMRYRYRGTTYRIAVRQTLAGPDAEIHATTVAVDGVEQPDRSVTLVDDGAEHDVLVDVCAAEHPARPRAAYVRQRTDLAPRLA